jgi:hypothetical protein
MLEVKRMGTKIDANLEMRAHVLTFILMCKALLLIKLITIARQHFKMVVYDSRHVQFGAELNRRASAL